MTFIWLIFTFLTRIMAIQTYRTKSILSQFALYAFKSIIKYFIGFTFRTFRWTNTFHTQLWVAFGANWRICFIKPWLARTTEIHWMIDPICIEYQAFRTSVLISITFQTRWRARWAINLSFYFKIPCYARTSVIYSEVLAISCCFTFCTFMSISLTLNAWVATAYNYINLHDSNLRSQVSTPLS